MTPRLYMIAGLSLALWAEAAWLAGLGYGLGLHVYIAACQAGVLK
jgi:hypothetical protein